MKVNNQPKARMHAARDCVDIATRIGVAPTLVASSGSTRAWVEISKGF